MSMGKGVSAAASGVPMVDSADVIEHFTARATGYDRSSRWCSDPELMQRLIALGEPRPADRMLDLACGTGLISEAFRGRVASITGLDLTPAMMANAEFRADQLTLGSAESMPFRDETFNLVVCRQGLQFMNAERAIAEMLRVIRRSGRVVLVDLCAYGEEREEYFEILRLRNPARRNFFVAEDLTHLLRRAGCAAVSSFQHISRENVDVWSANGAISESNRERIRAIYRNASPAFRRLHAPEYMADGNIVDHMLFVITVGVR